MSARLAAALLLALFIPLALAELPPSAYETMQKNAPEYLEIEILRVDVEPGDAPERQNVRLMALVNSVNRTASGLRSGDLIQIIYVVTNRPSGWSGPGELKIPAEKDKTVAYLKKDAETPDFHPMAGVMSFQNF